MKQTTARKQLLYRRCIATVTSLWKLVSRRTPPGVLNPFDFKLFSDQRRVLTLSQKLGPIFKASRKGRWTTYIVGHPHIRRVLADNGTGLPCATIDLTPLFPVGFIRGMDGDVHAAYRRQLVHVFQSVSLSEHEKQISQYVSRCLDKIGLCATNAAMCDITPMLRDAASAVMFGILFGISEKSSQFASLREAFLKFGPGQPASNIGSEQVANYCQIRDIIDQQIARLRQSNNGTEPSSVLQSAVKDGTVDETLLGNIIYMHEPSHFDIFSLWRWIIFYLGGNPEVAAHFRSLEPDHRRELARSIVQETLRLNQSELLLRTTTKDIEYLGYSIPQNTSVRLCLWEGHKNPENFPDPFHFDPARFLKNRPSTDQFAPFGMDRHRCIGVDIAMVASINFVEQLINRFDVTIITEKPVYRGAYHWEPDPTTEIRLMPTTARK